MCVVTIVHSDTTVALKEIRSRKRRRRRKMDMKKVWVKRENDEVIEIKWMINEKNKKTFLSYRMKNAWLWRGIVEVSQEWASFNFERPKNVPPYC